MSTYSYLAVSHRSDVGMVREHNEDSVVVIDSHAVYCVADGMGGAQAGEIASRMVVEAMERELQGNPDQPGHDNLQAKRILSRAAIRNANRSIREYVEEKHLSNSGSTVVVLLFDHAQPRSAHALHAGDSRLYRIRGERIEQLTKDHSLLAESNLTDERQLNPMFRGIVTRAVGMEKQISVEDTPVEVEPGDYFLLCSDGLSNMIDDERIRGIVCEHADDLPAAADRLIEAANAAGGRDNISAILVQVAGDLPPASEGMLPLPEMDLPDDTGDYTDDTFSGEGETSQSNPSNTFFSTEADLDLEIGMAQDTFSHSRTITVEMETVDVPVSQRSRLKTVAILLCVIAGLALAIGGLVYALSRPVDPPPPAPPPPTPELSDPVPAPPAGDPDAKPEIEVFILDEDL